MRKIDELRPLTAGQVLGLWRACREAAEDPLERTLLCNARALALCCYFRGEPVYDGELAVLADLTGREMETLLVRLAQGGQPPMENPGFDLGRFLKLREGE